MNEYEKQANDFVKKTSTTFVAKFDRFGLYFPDDKEKRDVYTITLSRNGRSYSFKFGQSIKESQHYFDRIRAERITEKRAKQLAATNVRYVKGKPPTAYDVLSCLTKYEPGTFEQFCSEFGSSTDSIKAKNTYEAVREEYLNLCALFTDSELEIMAEIQ